MIWIAAYLLSGALVGLLAGLLGLGGGMTLVPILSALFSAQSLAPGYIVHMNNDSTNRKVFTNSNYALLGVCSTANVNLPKGRSRTCRWRRHLEAISIIGSTSRV